ncbi:hypothetical protein GCM10027592_59150 [Spirosoma flavus]
MFELHQYVPHEELIQLLDTATCLLYTSALEPFGYAPLEANSCGLPVVLVGEGGVREMVRNNYNGLLTSRDTGEIAQALEKILTYPKLAQRLPANGRKMVREHWDVNHSVDRIEQFLSSVATRGQAA